MPAITMRSLALLVLIVTLCSGGCRSTAPGAGNSPASPPRAARPTERITPRSQSTPKRTITKPATVELALVGDVLPRNVSEPFRDAAVRRALSSADIAFANLECPLTKRGTPVPMKFDGSGRILPNEWLFRAPPMAATSLRNAGIDVVSLANNHMMDYGPVALSDTISALTRNGVRHTGAGPNLYAARRHAVVTRRGIRVAFLAYTEEDTLPDTVHFEAAPKRPGMAFVREGSRGQPDDVTRRTFIDDVKAARADADIVAISFHWGKEFQPRPTAFQRGLARSAIDAGANLVIGHHPHCLQGVETYKGRPIFYSLGNFVFHSGYDLCNRSGIARVKLNKNGVTGVVFQPVWVQNARPTWTHRRATESAAVLHQLSRELGSRSTLGRVNGRTAVSISFAPAGTAAASTRPAVASQPRGRAAAKNSPTPRPSSTGPVPAGFVDIRKALPGVLVQLPYASAQNVFGTRFYRTNRSLLRAGSAHKLRTAQNILWRSGLRLKIWDAYRPLSVQQRMWNQVRDARYVANPASGGSNHNRGAAVDVTLVGRDGRELEMPTGYDDFSERAHANYAGGSAATRRNRALLRQAMVRAGFRQLATEWWHFDDTEARRYPITSVAIPN